MKRPFSVFMNTARAAMMLAAVTLATACAKDKPAAILAIDKKAEPIEFPADGSESFTYQVTTNQSSWDATSSQTWCKVSKTTDSFTVTADAATTTVAPPEATITVTAGEATPIKIKVTQKAADAALSIEPAPEGGVVEFPAAGETKAFIVTTTVPNWSVESDKDWCKAEKSADSKGFTLKAEAITATVAPEEATVTVTGGDATPISFKVTQKAPDAALSIAPVPERWKIEFSAAGEAKTFTVTTNLSAWDVVSDKDWCKAEKSADGKGFTLTAARNGFPTAKEDATVTVSAEGVSDIVLTAKQAGTPPSVFGDDIVAAESYGGGDGTAENPYLITSAAELRKLFSELPADTAGKYYRLDVDIEITAASWIPMGLQGNFDGNGHTVSGKLISGYDNAGFFAEVYIGTVSNLTVDADVKFTKSRSRRPSAGGIAGLIREAKITNCTVKGSVTGSNREDAEIDYGMHVGGIVGRLYSGSVVENCTNYALVSGGRGARMSTNNFYTGGIAGNASGLVTGCINNGTVIGGLQYSQNSGVQHTGGIVGHLDDTYGGDGAVHQCSNNGDVVSGTGREIKTGGIVGYAALVNDSHNVYSCNANTGRVDLSPGSDDNRIGEGEISQCTEGH